MIATLQPLLVGTKDLSLREAPSSAKIQSSRRKRHGSAYQTSRSKWSSIHFQLRPRNKMLQVYGT